MLVLVLFDLIYVNFGFRLAVACGFTRRQGGNLLMLCRSSFGSPLLPGGEMAIDSSVNAIAIASVASGRGVWGHMTTLWGLL